MFNFITCIYRDFRDRHIAIYAGNASFFLILSVFPFSLLILGLTQWLPIDVGQLLELLGSVFPDSVQSVFRGLFRIYNPMTLISASAVAALWSASRGTYGLLRGLNRAYRLQETRGYWSLRLHCFFETFLLILALAAALLLYVFGQPISQRLEATRFRMLFGSATRFLVATAVLVLLFALLYVFLPNHHVSFGSVLPGAAFSGAGWMAFSTLYSLYVSHISNIDRIYGSLSAIGLAMLWLYICMEIFFLGGILNHQLTPME